MPYDRLLPKECMNALLLMYFTCQMRYWPKKIDVYGKIFSHRKGNFRKDLLSFLPEKKRISIGFEQNSQWHMISRENLFSYGNVWIKVIKELLLSYRNYNSCRILFKNPTRFQNTWHPVGNFSYFPMGY